MQPICDRAPDADLTVRMNRESVYSSMVTPLLPAWSARPQICAV
jgi:hypothetical protein